MNYRLKIDNKSGQDLTSIIEKARTILAPVCTVDLVEEYPHSVMTITNGATMSGYTMLSHKSDGAYLTGLRIGACQLPGDASNYCGSYEDAGGTMAHEILHTIYKEVIGDQAKSEDFLHEFKSNYKAVEWLRNNWAIKNNPDKVIIHHTASAGMNPQYDAVNTYHIQQGWGEIGYNLFIEKSGQIKMGRWQFREGAHTINENQRSIGICLAGEFDTEEPTQAQLDSLDRLLKDEVLPIHGHYEFANKSCPGKNIIKHLPTQMKWIILRSNNQYVVAETPKWCFGISDASQLIKMRLTGEPTRIDKTEAMMETEGYTFYPSTTKENIAKIVALMNDIFNN